MKKLFALFISVFISTMFFAQYFEAKEKWSFMNTKYINVSVVPQYIPGPAINGYTLYPNSGTIDIYWGDGGHDIIPFNHSECPSIDSGFAGSPWTIFCYAVEGKGSKSFDIAKGFCFTHPEAAHVLLQKITDTTILYLKEKVKSGVNAVQIFDSWGGMLSPMDYQEFSWKYINQIVEALADEIPVIVFGKGCWFALGEMGKSRASALGVDWTCSPRNARYLSGGNITLQGNFDPSRLLSPIPTIKKMVHQMIDEFGKDKYIVNLGHGILPNIPVDHAKAFIDAVKEYK